LPLKNGGPQNLTQNSGSGSLSEMGVFGVWRLAFRVPSSELHARARENVPA